MLAKDKNELLTRVGPGTPMNALLRRYWMPALLSSDLTPDGDPKRLMLLGEHYVAFRDTDGRVGVLDETCCHRGSSLMLGRNEDNGLRCIFHGWKYGVDGTILDTPNVADPAYKSRFRQPAYPVREAGDLIWVYLGDPKLEPPFREYEYMRLPPSHRMVMRLNIDCNFLQVVEGGLDSSHVGILHHDLASLRQTAELEKLPQNMQLNRQKLLTDMAPRFEVRDTEFGFHYAALRAANDGTNNVNVRVTAFVAPTTIMIPPKLFVIHDIPYDDVHTGWIVTHWNPNGPVDREAMTKVMALDTNGFWVNDRVLQSPENGYLQNRDAMRKGSWSGLYGLGPEDAAVNLSQGPVLDRTKEHLVPADVACTRVRRLLLDAVQRVSEGGDPPGLRPSQSEKIAAVEFTMPDDEMWTARVPGNVEVAESTASLQRA
jgi:phthalate 4,5-dioxygenase oxygenase subunit